MLILKDLHLPTPQTSDVNTICLLKVINRYKYISLTSRFKWIKVNIYSEAGCVIAWIYSISEVYFSLHNVHSLSLLPNVLISASSELPNSRILPLILLAGKICVTLHCFVMAFLYLDIPFCISCHCLWHKISLLLDIKDHHNIFSYVYHLQWLPSQG